MSETINGEVRRHETSLAVGAWLHPISSEKSVDLAKLSRICHQFFDLFNAEYFGDQLPQPLITFQGASRRNLGHFRFGRNGIGAKFEINLNTRHLDRSLMDQLKTLLHEMDHLAQDAFPAIYSPDKKPQPGRYHNKAFQKLTASQGIPCSAKGITIAILDPFKAFCISHGVEAIEYCVETAAEDLPRHDKKLRKWTCQCKPIYGIWIATGKDFKGHCNVCQADFQLAR